MAPVRKKPILYFAVEGNVAEAAAMRGQLAQLAVSAGALLTDVSAKVEGSRAEESMRATFPHYRNRRSFLVGAEDLLGQNLNSLPILTSAGGNGMEVFIKPTCG